MFYNPDITYLQGMPAASKSLRSQPAPELFLCYLHEIWTCHGATSSSWLTGPSTEVLEGPMKNTPLLHSDLVKKIDSFPGGSEGKASACNVVDLCLIPGWGRSPGERNVSPLQYSCLENPMDRGAW